MKDSSVIHVVSPAGAVNKINLAAGISYISGFDFLIKAGKSIFQKKGYFAGTDTDRQYDLQLALDDPNALAIWVARGGYGTTRIIDTIIWKKFFKKPSWIIGFSDITAFHIHLSNHNIPSIHGPMVAQAADDNHKEAVDLVTAILKNDFPDYLLRSNKKNRPGKAKAPITGGNLTLICSTIGTATEIITDNKILFIEEVGEAAYRVDRMMVQLKRSGKLKKLKGLIVGHMTDITHEDEFGQSVTDIILSHTKEYTFPICFDFPAGHEAPNMPVILGLKSELIVAKSEITLRYL
jgi:muramoyltetrapeptide carboxypeptidase